MSRRIALAVTALAAVAVSTVPGSASARGDGHGARLDHWGVIARNTIGSPVAALRNGPFGPYNVQGRKASPPYGRGSLGIEVADYSTSLTPHSEKVDFGNEVDFRGDRVLGLQQVGFHVFQTSENIAYGGTDGGKNMPNIKFEIDPNLTADSGNYSTMIWVPDASPVTDGWSRYLNAATTGQWYLTGNAGVVTGCNQTTKCTFKKLKEQLDDGGAEPTVLTAAVGKGRDYMWIGAVDGLRINRNVYDFEPYGVVTRRVR